MKVKELKEILEDIDQDKDIYISDVSKMPEIIAYPIETAGLMQCTQMFLIGYYGDAEIADASELN
jgi:hypothetical protein